MPRLPSPIDPDLLAAGIRPSDSLAVASNRSLNANDWGKTLDCTAAGLTLTVPVGLPPDFWCNVIPNGTTSIASDGTALLNGATTTVARIAATAANTMFVVRNRSVANSYVVTGA